MSDRESGGFGAFLLGLAVGAVAGLLFAPEAGQGTRRKLSRRLQDLRDFAEEKADDVRGMLESDDDEEPEEAEEPEAEDDGRAELQRRLQAARRRRKRAAAAAEGEEEDEPVA